tara:strand:- start:133 stop:321 length:189 start_codon:yes stop_codon:yes gene_type:complete
MKAVIDKFTGRFISRKFLAWIVGTVLCYVGHVASADWIMLTTVYIGTQGAVDAVMKLKGLKH